VLIDPKADLYRMARDWAMTNGFQKRLVLFDLSGAGNVLPGYNPLRENGLRIDLQTQWVRESVRSAWGNSSFETTPLLARMLYLTLYSARALSVDMLQALDVLRPSPTLRHAAIQRITDPFVRGSLVAFDNLSDRFKAEQSNSTISRLEMFLCDEVVRKVICSPQSLDLEQLLSERKIILVNFGRYQPLLPDAVKLLGRMFFNDLLAHLFKLHGEGKFDEDKPYYIICDEIQNFATKQVCDALDEGAGIGCHMTIAHQHLHQLADEDQSVYLLHSVLSDARTKMCFGGLAPDDLQILSELLMMRHFDPWRIKHVQRNPVFVPVKTVVKVPTFSTSRSKSRSVTESESETDSLTHSEEHSTSRGHSLAASVAHTTGEQESYSFGSNSSDTDSAQWGSSTSETHSQTRSRAHTDGAAVGHARGHGRTISDGTTDSSGRNSASGWSAGESSTDSSGRSAAAGRSQNSGLSTTTSTGEGQVMLPVEERMFACLEEEPVVLTTSAHTGSAEARSSSSGSSQMEGSQSGHADSRMRGTSGVVGSSTAHAHSRGVADTSNESDSITRSGADTTGFSEGVARSVGTHEAHGTAHTDGVQEAWMRGTNRSLTLGNKVTNSESATDGTSDSVGHAITHGSALTEGETDTDGESVTMSPFYDYVREETEVPTYLTPEEQRLLEMQKLYRPKKQHMVVIAPDNPDCLVHVPDVDDPIITKRRLAAGLESVHAQLQCYITLEQLGVGDVRRDRDDTDIVDVEAKEVGAPEMAAALPSPAATENLTEDEWWDRWRAMGHGRKPRHEK
jgi:hypothetical protein